VNGLVVRQLTESDLVEADRINRVAFGTFFGLPDPLAFRGDGQVVPGRFQRNPDGAFAADLDGKLVACGFVMDWGSVGIFGPLTVDVNHWGKGIARRMLDAMTGYMDKRGFALHGLFTHPQSATHIRLYEEYGFRMQRVTAVMDKQVDLSRAMPIDTMCFSTLNDADRQATLKQCAAVTAGIYEGMDLSGEILSINANGFGDTVLLRVDGRLAGFACCHQGAGSEAGSSQTLIKFAAVTPGLLAGENFSRLLKVCESFAAHRGTGRLVAGTNSGRCNCYEALRNAGFRTWMNGIAMIKPDHDGYNSSETYVIDDWR
jgi:GNAT superfamily N-acetyltransferase